MKTLNEQLHQKIRDKESLIDEWNLKFSDMGSVKGEPAIKSRPKDTEKGTQEIMQDVDDEMSFNLLDSNRIDDIYATESKEFELAEKQMEIQEMAGKLSSAQEAIERLQQQLIEVCNRERGWETAMAERDFEIENLKERLKDEDKRKASGGGLFMESNFEDLKEMLEEKDRHIHDLTKTLTHFHVSVSN